MRRLIAFCLIVGLALPVAAQDQTLADIRQELAVLHQDIQQLKRELSTTGGATTGIGGDTLQRVDLIERALQRLTARTEELEFRISSVVRDGTNRVGDLEFRLCELEAACDIATLSDTPMLGGPAPESVGATTATVATTSSNDTAQLAIGEQADFDAAIAAYNDSDFTRSAQLFGAFVDNYPGSPMAGEALMLKGAALRDGGDTAGAARSFLEAFSREPNGPQAAGALTELGKSLAQLGQTSEACIMLGEVQVRFPGSQHVAEAQSERARLGCS